jgi:hypothetical protein
MSSKNKSRYPNGHFSSIENECPHCGCTEYNVVGIQVVRGTLLDVDDKMAIVDLSHVDDTWTVDPMYIQCNECNMLFWEGLIGVFDNLSTIVR